MDHKQKCIAIIALLLALVAISIGGSVITNESIFQIEVNNTNLAPNSSDSVGTGDRIQNVTYFANSTPIELFVFSHGATSGQNAEIHLTINGTVVSDVAGKPLGSAEQNNYSIIAMIPRYASYSVQVNNFHHYEWREYRVISGQNGSVIINNIGSSINNSALNEKVNKSGDTMTGNLSIQNITNSDYVHIIGTNGLIFNGGDSELTINSGFNYGFLGMTKILYVPKNVFVPEYVQFTTPMRYLNDSNYYDNNITGVNNLNMTGDINLGGHNLTNCGNCTFGTGTDNTKVNKSGDNMTGTLNMSTNEITNISKATIINTNYNITSGLFGVADIYMVSSGSTVGFFSFGNVNSFSAYRFNNNGTYNYTYLTTGEQILAFAVGGINTTATTTNATAGATKGSFRLAAAANWNETYQPTKIEFLTNNGSANNIAMTIQDKGNIEMGVSGKGIQMKSPNGNIWCTTVTNAGTLSTVAGACT